MNITLNKIKDLALYHYDSCPYCAKVRRAIYDLSQKFELWNIEPRNIELRNIELRNIELEPQHYIDLLEGGGKPQVPCLRIKNTDGNDEWLYESDEIINFLAKQQNELFHLALTA